jgi:hypothetical protein
MRMSKFSPRLYWVLSPLLLPLFFVVVNPAAFRQTSGQVVTREPGRRFLGAPHPVATEAAKHLEFAWLSQSAYRKTPAGKNEDQPAGCPYPDVSLKERGWTLWTGFPDRSLQSTIDRFHLRVEVWENASRGAIAVAFGGTVFNNRNDWRSNLRWFIADNSPDTI